MIALSELGNRLKILRRRCTVTVRHLACAAAVTASMLAAGLPQVVSAGAPLTNESILVVCGNQSTAVHLVMPGRLEDVDWPPGTFWQRYLSPNAMIIGVSVALGAGTGGIIGGLPTGGIGAGPGIAAGGAFGGVVGEAVSDAVNADDWYRSIKIATIAKHTGMYQACSDHGGVARTEHYEAGLTEELVARFPRGASAGLCWIAWGSPFFIDLE